MLLEPGRSGRASLQVSDTDTAIAHESGDVPVLATPKLIALCEKASLAAVAGSFDPGTTTVGVRVQIDHLSPTTVGGEVDAEATLEKVEGRRLTFTVSVSDQRGLVAAGKVTRAVVDREHFLEKAT